MCVFVFLCCYFVAVTVAVADFILHPLRKELSMCIGYPEQQEKSLHHVSQDAFFLLFKIYNSSSSFIEQGRAGKCRFEI